MDIKAIIFDIRRNEMNLDKSEKEQYYAKKYSKFVSRYPFLFKQALDDSFPMDLIDYMLEQKKNYKENKDVVDKEVFDALNEKYVIPVLEKNEST